jgi:iron(III) transport system ATP-binding protein
LSLGEQSGSEREAAGVAITASRLTKAYGHYQALGDGLDLHVPAGCFATLLGPSGSGKTTTLRCIAGLERPDGGRISLGSKVVFEGGGTFVAPQGRNLGMVFQSFAVWPHMTVAANVAYPLKIRRKSGGRRDIDNAVGRTLAQVGLAAFRDRYPGQLSGGQQQRVALARAIVANSPVVLFDEPLSNLDAQLREQMRRELRILHAELGMTALYVTHDQTEAMELSDLVFLMDAGQIVQSGPPVEVYERPTSVFACQMMGAANVFTIARVEDGGQDQTVRVQLREGLSLVARAPRGDAAAPAHVALRPHRIELCAEGDAGAITGQVLDFAYLGERARTTVRVGEADVRIDAFSAGRRLQKGDTAAFRVAPDDVILI